MNLSAASSKKSALYNIQEWRHLAKALPWLVLVISLAVTFLMWKSEQKNAVHDLQMDFDSRVRDTNLRIEQRMKVYEQMLRGVQGAFAALSNMGRSEFHTYVSTLKLERDYPGVHGVGFSLVVPASQKDKHIAAMRREGFPAYLIRPEGARDIYTPTIYLEPFSEHNQQAWGFDNATDPVRFAAMERARDIDLPIVSGKIVPDKNSKDNQVQESFRMYLPVFKNGAPHDTVESRRANINGWIFSRFSMRELMDGILGETASEIDIDIHDGEEITDKSVMYDPDDSADSEDKSEIYDHDVSNGQISANALFFSVNRIQIAGHYWTIATRSQYPFEMRINREKPQFVAYAGIVGSLLLMLLTEVLVRSRASALEAAHEINRELTERKRAEERLRVAATMLQTVDEAVIVTDPDNNIISVNPAFHAITGYSTTDVIGKNPRLLSSGKHTSEFYKELWDTLLTTETWHGEIWDRRKSGELYIKWLSIKVMRDERGKLTHYMGVFSNSSNRKNVEDRLKFLTLYDALTGLPNRATFSDRLQQSLARARLDNSHFTLILIELDKFKFINDTFGHPFGDLLLKEVAKRLQNCISESDTVARVGGDEFCLLLTSIEKEQDARLISDKVQQSLNQSYELAGISLNIFASMGVAIYPEHGEDEIVLTRNVNTAMNYAKGNERDKVKFYETGMQEFIEEMRVAPTAWEFFFNRVASSKINKKIIKKTRPFVIVSNNSPTNTDDIK